jgi:oligosaccharyltransferase complex subunit alpha (ribophorin I)
VSNSRPWQYFELIPRSPTPNILSHSEVPSTYTRDNTVTKASSTITLGPFHALPATLGDGVERQSFNVHFETKEPVMGVRSLRRSAEVSHWGANLNIQDEVHLVNNGPKYVLTTSSCLRNSLLI